MVWMRTAGLGRFKKLWGRIHTWVKKGKYTLEINNQYDVGSFKGKKTFIMTTTSPFGQKNMVF